MCELETINVSWIVLMKMWRRNLIRHCVDVSWGAQQLTPGKILRITKGKGVSVRVISGRVWITEFGCIDDTFLVNGQVYEITSEGLALIENDLRKSVTTIVLNGTYQG